ACRAPLAVVAGRFLTPGRARDLLVISNDPTAGRRVWLFSATSGLGYPLDAPPHVLTKLGALANLEIKRLAAADLDGDGFDDLIALGAAPGGAALVVTMPLGPESVPTVRTIDPGVGAPRDL